MSHTNTHPLAQSDLQSINKFGFCFSMRAHYRWNHFDGHRSEISWCPKMIVLCVVVATLYTCCSSIPFDSICLFVLCRSTGKMCFKQKTLWKAASANGYYKSIKKRNNGKSWKKNRTHTREKWVKERKRRAFCSKSQQQHWNATSIRIHKISAQ